MAGLGMSGLVYMGKALHRQREVCLTASDTSESRTKIKTTSPSLELGDALLLLMAVEREAVCLHLEAHHFQLQPCMPSSGGITSCHLGFMKSIIAKLRGLKRILLGKLHCHWSCAWMSTRTAKDNRSMTCTWMILRQGGRLCQIVTRQHMHIGIMIVHMVPGISSGCMEVGSGEIAHVE